MKISLVRESKEDALRTYFLLLQFIFPKSKQLTELELELLVLFLTLPEKYRHHRFSTIAKNKVIESAKVDKNWLLSRININNKLYSMIEKGVLTRDEDGVIYLNKMIEKGIEALSDARDKGAEMDITFNLKWGKEQK